MLCFFSSFSSMTYLFKAPQPSQRAQRAAVDAVAERGAPRDALDRGNEEGRDVHAVVHGDKALLQLGEERIGGSALL